MIKVNALSTKMLIVNYFFNDTFIDRFLSFKIKYDFKH